jgi:hypothetical protein
MSFAESSAQQIARRGNSAELACFLHASDCVATTIASGEKHAIIPETQAVSRTGDRRSDEDGVQEVVGSNPAGPTVFQVKPFGADVEGLSHCRDESYAIET